MKLDESGQSLVEWALILPVFIILFVGLIDFGWAFGKQHSVSQIAKELARSASVGDTIDELKDEAFELSKAVIVPDTITHTEVDNTSVFTISDANGKEVIITFEETLVNRSKGLKFKVKVEYVYKPFTPLVNNADILLTSEYYTKSETSHSN